MLLIFVIIRFITNYINIYISDFFSYNYRVHSFKNFLDTLKLFIIHVSLANGGPIRGFSQTSGTQMVQSKISGCKMKLSALLEGGNSPSPSPEQSERPKALAAPRNSQSVTPFPSLSTRGRRHLNDYVRRRASDLRSERGGEAVRGEVSGHHPVEESRDASPRGPVPLQQDLRVQL